MTRTRRLCVCRPNEPSCCILQFDSENCFSTVDHFEQFLNDHQLDTTTESEEHRSTLCPQGHKALRWKEVEDCSLYHIFVYDQEGNRVREHEIIASRRKTNHQIPKQLDMRVICLFESSSDHGFVDVYKASGLGEYELVVDLLSSITLKGRHPINFGFLCPSFSEFNASITVAIKREKIDPTREMARTEVRKQIDLALLAGGRYNMKYLACTDVEDNTAEVWIAMELCRMKIFDDLIMEKRGSPYYLDLKKMKTCFKRILKGLIQLHDNGIKHGELTTENILVTLDGSKLKIGDYDHVKQIQKNSNGEVADEQDDMKMTARVFYKCLKRDAKCDSKILTEVDEDELVSWISSIPVLSSSREEHVARIAEVIFHKAKSSSIKNAMSNKMKGLPLPNRLGLLMKLVEELKNCEDPYLSSYLIMHMALDNPTPKSVLMNPFFWNEHKVYCFIARIFAWFHREQCNCLVGIQGQQVDVACEVEKEFRESCEHALPDINPFAEDERLSHEEMMRFILDSEKLSAFLCLLHYAAARPWSDSHPLPDEIRKFFDDHQDSDTLNFPLAY